MLTRCICTYRNSVDIQAVPGEELCPLSIVVCWWSAIGKSSSPVLDLLLVSDWYNYMVVLTKDQSGILNLINIWLSNGYKKNGWSFLMFGSLVSFRDSQLGPQPPMAHREIQDRHEPSWARKSYSRQPCRYRARLQVIISCFCAVSAVCGRYCTLYTVFGHYHAMCCLHQYDSYDSGHYDSSQSISQSVSPL